MDEVSLNLFFSDCPAIPSYHASALGNFKIKKSVSIYLTHACNLRCKTCYLSAGKPLKNELPTEEYKNIFFQISKMGFEMVYLLGGEPMLREDIFEIIQMAKNFDLYTSMSSNAFFINEKNARKLKDSGLDQVQISIDSADKNKNDFIRGEGSFKNALDAILNLKKSGIKVSMGFTITKFYNNVNAMVKLARSLGINVLNISVVEPFGRARIFNVVPDREDVKNAIEMIKNHRGEIKLTFNGFRFFLEEEIFNESLENIPENYHSCPAGHDRFVIDSNGDVYGCELLMHREFLEGNAVKDDLESIWKNGFNVFRERKLPVECEKCKFKKSCQGGCPARSYISGSLDRKDPLCPL
ncbi:MAG: radical SAM protein, partial [Thermoplasmata archaeon]